jgi:hypothetical protein
MTRTEFTELVTDAIKGPTLAAFEARLHDAGFALEIRGHDPCLVPVDGGHCRWLHAVNLSRSFWAAFARWPDALEPWLKSTGKRALERLWHGLSGYACGCAQRRILRELEARLGVLRTATAMSAAVEAAGAIRTGEIFRRFARACDNGALVPQSEHEFLPATASVGMGTAAMSVDADNLMPRATPTPFTRLPPPPPSQASMPPYTKPGVGADAPVPVAAIPQQHGGELPSGPVPESLEHTAIAALKKPLCSCFRGCMLGAGYEVRLQGGNAVFAPLNGAPSVSFEELGIAREFWLRMVEWPDGFVLGCVDGGLHGLCELWSGLFGCPPGPDEVAAIRRLLLHLHLPAVAHAAYDTATHEPSASAQHRLAHFEAVAAMMLRQLRKGLSVNERRAAAMAVPAGMRPQYRWIGREIRSKNGGISEILPPITATSAEPSTAPAAVFDKDNDIENKTRSATWANA